MYWEGAKKNLKPNGDGVRSQIFANQSSGALQMPRYIPENTRF